MAIIGSTPETGVRIDVSRPRDGGPPWRYEGEAVTAGARVPVTATVSAEGHVVVEIAVLGLRAALPGGPADADRLAESLHERLRLLLRAAYKHAREDGQPPPRRIVRWRADADVAPPRADG
jgi:hypothetical protein